MNSKHFYLRAVSGEPKSILEAWRDAFLQAERAYQDFGRNLGATGLVGMKFHRPTGLQFPRGIEAPEGWRKPAANGFTTPKKASKDIIAQWNAIPFPKTLSEVAVASFALPTSVTVTTEKSKLTAGLGGLHGYTAAWSCRADGSLDDFILVAPDFSEYDGKEGVVWGPDGTSPEIPEGFVRMSDAEVDLLFAQNEVARERYEAAGKEIALMVEGAHTPSDLYAAISSAASRYGRNIYVNFDSGDEGLSVDVSYEGETIKAHPAMRKAVEALVPMLVRCEASDWSEDQKATGRILWRHGSTPYLDMDDSHNDWTYESEIDVEMLQDMAFDDAPAPDLQAP